MLVLGGCRSDISEVKTIVSRFQVSFKKKKRQHQSCFSRTTSFGEGQVFLCLSMLAFFAIGPIQICACLNRRKPISSNLLMLQYCFGLFTGFLRNSVLFHNNLFFCESFSAVHFNVMRPFELYAFAYYMILYTLFTLKVSFHKTNGRQQKKLEISDWRGDLGDGFIGFFIFPRFGL